MALERKAPTELGTESVGKLLKKYAVPGIIAMTASSLYNMVDSIFIGHIPDVGSLALAGLAVTFPLMNLSAALGTLVGVGAAHKPQLHHRSHFRGSLSGVHQPHPLLFRCQ